MYYGDLWIGAEQRAHSLCTSYNLIENLGEMYPDFLRLLLTYLKLEEKREIETIP